jgi:SAM-dependent methyltransferase
VVTLPSVSTATGGFPPLILRSQMRWDVVGRLIRQLQPSTVIEIGVGQGAAGARIASIASRSYTAFELDPSSFEVAAARIEPFGGVVHNRPIAEIGPPPADLLCAFEVLEHIEQDADALGEWCRYVVPGGHLMLSVPAFPHRFGPMDTYAGHYRRYSPDQLTGLVSSLGLLDVRTVVYGAPLGYALEAVRNRLDARRLARLTDAERSPQARTSASGRFRQFSSRSWRSSVVNAAAIPFCHLQRVWPGGVGLVLVARKPS